MQRTYISTYVHYNNMQVTNEILFYIRIASYSYTTNFNNLSPKHKAGYSWLANKNFALTLHAIEQLMIRKCNVIYGACIKVNGYILTYVTV